MNLWVKNLYRAWCGWLIFLSWSLGPYLGIFQRTWGLESFGSSSLPCLPPGLWWLKNCTQLGLLTKALHWVFHIAWASHSMVSGKGESQEGESQEEHQESKCSKSTRQKLYDIWQSSLRSHTYHSYHALLVESVTNPLRVKGREHKPHFSIGDVSRNLYIF